MICNLVNLPTKRSLKFYIAGDCVTQTFVFSYKWLKFYVKYADIDLLGFKPFILLFVFQLDPYMDENFIKQAFSTMGETAYGVKIITHRVTG